MLKYCILLFIVYTLTFAVKQPGEHVCPDFEVGKPIVFQCKDLADGIWKAGPVCVETSQPAQFLFGKDSFLTCGIHINSSDIYNTLRSIVVRDQEWACRVAMSSDHQFYIPVSIPLWGVAETDHIHINNHVNFVFHADKGKIVAATSYPVRDRFQFVKPGAVLTLHGPVKWFAGHSFRDYISSGLFAVGGPTAGSVGFTVVWCALTFAVTALGFGLFFKYNLRPRLLRSVLKRD